MPAPAKAAPVHGTSRHHSSNMMHSDSTKRDSNCPGLDSEIIRFQDAASKINTKIDKNSVEQNNSKKLKFSIDEILNKKQQKEKIQVHTKIKEKRITQNLQMPPSRDSNTDQEKVNQCRTSGGDIAIDEPTSRYTSEFMPNQVRSNSHKIQLHQMEKNNGLDQSKINYATNRQGVNYSGTSSDNTTKDASEAHHTSELITEVVQSHSDQIEFQQKNGS
jgi:hypothetical protein